jgi:hypothetical protein
VAALAWIEVLDRRGQVRTRHRVDEAPALIGRGYGCDVLLDDPWISPIHLRLFRELDGSLSFEDAGSENGVFTADGDRVTARRVDPAAVFRVGQTLIRIVPADAPVAPTLATHAAAPTESGFGRPIVGPILALAAALLVAIGEHLESAAATDRSEIISSVIATLVVLAAWAGVWALIGRAVAHRARFLAHLAVASAGVVVFTMISAVEEYAEFVFPGADALTGVIGGLGLASVTLVLFGHLMFASALPALRAFGISIVVTIGLASLALLASSGDEHSAMPEFSGLLKPLSTSIIPAQDTTAFFGDLTELKTSIDSLIAEAP